MVFAELTDGLKAVPFKAGLNRILPKNTRHILLVPEKQEKGRPEGRPFKRSSYSN